MHGLMVNLAIDLAVAFACWLAKTFISHVVQSVAAPLEAWIKAAAERFAGAGLRWAGVGAPA
jgi:hypothetical protein